MGVHFFLIDCRAPIGALRVVDSSYPRHTYTGNRVFRRLDPSVGVGETMASVVRRMCDEIGPHTLDVIRIFAHGSNRRDPESSDTATIQLGLGLNPSTASAFGSIHPLWHRTWQLDSYGLSHRCVVPRIEMHVCYANLWGGPVLQALANAARAPVFASAQAQAIATTNDNLSFEGDLGRYNPA